MKTPRHVAFIMDGNRRWAKENNSLSVEGHRAGYKIARKIPHWCFERGIEVVSFFGFSMENWKRDSEEVGYLLDLIKKGMKEQKKVALENNYRILISGTIEEFPSDLQEQCKEAVEKTKDNDKNKTVHICINYGGRREIVDAVKKIMEKGIKAQDIDEATFEKNLYQKNLIPDPDVIVRTSGVQRLSGFLPWQSTYSELMFFPKYWPDFSEKDVERIIKEYSRRHRRFGGNLRVALF